MKEYHKIDSVFKRDDRGKFLIGEFSRPEFDYLKDNPWLWTEKIDGTNIRIILQSSGEPGKQLYAQTWGGKTDNAQIPTKLFDHMLKTQHWTQEFLHETFGRDGNVPDVCLYGEGYGAGIQSGGNYSPEQKFILFDVKIGDWWLQRKDVEDIGAKLGLDVVPEYIDFTLTDMIHHVQETVAFNPIPRSKFGTAQVEGWVGTPRVPLFARNGDRIITKLKYKDFKNG